MKTRLAETVSRAEEFSGQAINEAQGDRLKETVKKHV